MKHIFLYSSPFRSYSFQSFFPCSTFLVLYFLSFSSVFLWISSTFSFFSFCLFPFLSSTFFLDTFYLSPQTFFVYHLIFLSVSISLSSTFFLGFFLHSFFACLLLYSPYSFYLFAHLCFFYYQFFPCSSYQYFLPFKFSSAFSAYFSTFFFLFCFSYFVLVSTLFNYLVLMLDFNYCKFSLCILQISVISSHSPLLFSLLRVNLKLFHIPTHAL